MACDDLITNQDLENAKKDATTMSDFVESDSTEIQSKNGKSIRTLQGINDAADNVISSLGGTDIGDYEDDLTLNSYNEYVVFDRAGATTGPSLWKAIPPRPPTPGTPLPYTIDSTAYPDPTSDSNIEPFSDINKDGAEKIAQEYSFRGDSIVSGGLIFPQDNDQSLSLGAQSTVVNIDANRFIVNTGSEVELLYIWEPSGTLPSAPFTIENIVANNFSGYTLTVDGSDYFIATEEIVRFRDDGDIAGWGVNPDNADSTDNLNEALSYASTNLISLKGKGDVFCNGMIVHPYNVSADFERCTFYCTNAALGTEFYQITNSTLPAEVRPVTIITGLRFRVTGSDIPVRACTFNGERVTINSFDCFGYQGGGLQVQSGFELYVQRFQAYLRDNQNNEFALELQTEDCEFDYVLITAYKQALNTGDGNRFKSVHVWGFPATIDNQNPNRQMNIGVRTGSGNIINNLFIDSPDVAPYADPMTNGALQIYGFENQINNLRYRISPGTRDFKVVLIEYDGQMNLISDIRYGQKGREAPEPIIYAQPQYIWDNFIGTSSIAPEVTTVVYDASEITMEGVTSKTGTLTIRRSFNKLSIFVDFTITGVVGSGTTISRILYPDILRCSTGDNTVCTIRGAVNPPASNANEKNTFVAYTEGSVGINYGFVLDTGGIQPTRFEDLQNGRLQFSIDVTQGLPF